LSNYKFDQAKKEALEAQSGLQKEVSVGLEFNTSPHFSFEKNSFSKRSIKITDKNDFVKIFKMIKFN
jgi:hypothetical protein